MPQKKWIDLDIRGDEQAVKKLKSAQANIQGSLKKIMLRAAMILEAEIKKQITEMGLVDTGNLRASVHSFVRTRLNSTEGVAGTTVDYAPFLEFGTGARGETSNHPQVPPYYQYGEHLGIKAYKFMWKSWMNKRDDIVAYVNSEIRKVVNWA